MTQLQSESKFLSLGDTYSGVEIFFFFLRVLLPAIVVIERNFPCILRRIGATSNPTATIPLYTHLFLFPSSLLLSNILHFVALLCSCGSTHISAQWLIFLCRSKPASCQKNLTHRFSAASFLATHMANRVRIES